MERKELKNGVRGKGHYSNISSIVWFISEIIIDRGCNSNFFYHCIIIKYIY